MDGHLRVARRKRRRAWPTVGARLVTAAIVMHLAIACDSDGGEEREWDFPPFCGSSSGCPGLAPMGGCFNSTGIDDLTVLGPACLIVDINNCARTMLEVRNDCEEDAVIGGAEVSAGSRFSHEIRKDSEGTFHLSDDPGSVSPHDELVTIEGTVGSEVVTITMFYSGDLC